MAIDSENPDHIDIDYSAYDQETQKLKPRVYWDVTQYSCLSGPDPETGIYGSGSTPDAAIKDWRSALQERFNRLHGDEPAEM